MDKVVNGVTYEQVPEERYGSCTGCVALTNDGCDLCELIKDKEYCQRNGFMIYKEKKNEK